MAVHNFDYTYAYVSCKATPKSVSDRTLIVREITVEITATDQADATQSITLEQSKVVNHNHLKSAETLPESFIQINNITNQQMIDWFTEGVTTEDLDGYFTWQLYGWEEVDPTVEE